MAAFLTPDSVRTVKIGGETLTIKQKIIPDNYPAPKYVASYVQKGQPMKPCTPLAGTGKAKGITVHNTGDIAVAAGTTPAEQYARATWNGNMGGVIVHFYVWNSEIWQLLNEAERGWHATDGSTRRSSQRTGETIGGNLDTIAIEAIGANAETEATAAKLSAYLLQEHDLSPEMDIYNHNYFYSAKYCPVYILPHWSAFISSVKACYNTNPGDGETSAGNAAGGVIAAGDTVAFLGSSVYASSAASVASSKRESSSCKVTVVSAGAKHPYHLISVDGIGVYGWVDASSVSEGVTPSEIAVGSTIKITGDKYATGQAIPTWVKAVEHKVSQINGDTALVGFPDGICSWICLKDLIKV